MNVESGLRNPINKPRYSEAAIRRWAKRDIARYGGVAQALKEARDEGNSQLIAHLLTKGEK